MTFINACTTGHEGEQRQQIKKYIYKKTSRKYIKNK